MLRPPPPTAGHDHEYYLLAGRAHATAIVKSGTDFRDCTEISLILSSPAAELVSPAPPATSSAAVAALAHLPSQLAQRCAEIADEAQERCSKWARLAAIPALTGCRLKAAADGAGASGAGAGMHACEPCGGDAEGASPDVAEAVSVYEACAAASLATSLVTTRPLGGAAGAPLLTVQAARHTITSELAEDAVVQEIVQASRRRRWSSSWHDGARHPASSASQGPLCSASSRPLCSAMSRS